MLANFLFFIFSWWEVSQVGKHLFHQYQFTNRVSESNAELEEEDSGIYWTQDEGAPEDNPGVTQTITIWLTHRRVKQM